MAPYMIYSPWEHGVCTLCTLCSIFAFVEVAAGFLAFFLPYKMLLEAQQIAFIDEEGSRM